MDLHLSLAYKSFLLTHTAGNPEVANLGELHSATQQTLSLAVAISGAVRCRNGSSNLV